jgi:hypothetical protein
LLAGVPLAACVLTVILWTRAAEPRDMAAEVFRYLFPGAPNALTMPDLLVVWCAGASLAPVLPLCLVLLLLLISGLPSYWFHPRSISVTRQNRAIALSYYTSAPLLLLPIAALGAALDSFGDWESVVPGALLTAARVLTIGLFLPVYVAPPLMWVNLLRLLWRVTDGDIARVAFAALGIPIGWFICIVLALGFIPAVIGACWMILESFR